MRKEVLATTIVAATMSMPFGAAAEESHAYTDEQIEAFAQAAVDSAEVRKQYVAELEGVESEEEQLAIIDEGREAMIAAIEDAPDITVDEYLEIGEAAAEDPELRNQVAHAVNELRDEPVMDDDPTE